MDQFLTDLFEEDQNDRKLDWNDPKTLKEVNNRDKARLKKVYKILTSNTNLTSEDKYHAAMVLQHSDKKEDYKKANELCAEAMREYEPAKWLYAASLDRFLLHSGKDQKYGTQFIKEDGKWILGKFDKQTTDAERKELGVPSLAHQLERVDQMNKDL